MTGRRDDAPPASPVPANPYADAPGSPPTAPVDTRTPTSRREARERSGTGSRPSLLRRQSGPQTRPIPKPPEPAGTAAPQARPGAVQVDQPDQLDRERMAAELEAQRAALELARRPRANRSATGRSATARSATARSATARSAPARSAPATRPGRPKRPAKARRPRNRVRLGPALATLVVLLIGFGLVVLGGLRATTLAPPPTLDATLRNNSRVPVLTTAVGLLGLEGPRARVTAQAATSSQTVFIGIGRAADVDAWLGSTARQELIGRNSQGQLLTRLAGSTPTVSDPASSDVWVVRVRARSAATVAWPRTGGQWRMVIASDGSAPAPARVTLTWSGRPTDTSAPILIAVGVVLMVGGGVTLVMLSSRSGLSSEPGDVAAVEAPAASSAVVGS